MSRMGDGALPPTRGDALVSAEFELTPEEWVAAVSSFAWDHPLHVENRKRQRRIWTAIMILFATLLLLVGAGPEALIVTIGLGVLIALFPWLYRRALKRAFTRSSRTGVTHGLFGPHRMEVTPEGLRDVTPAYEALWRWRAIGKVEEADGTFMVGTGPSSIVLLPSTAFRDSAHLRDFGDQFFHHLEAARAAALPDADPPQGSSPTIQ